LRRDKYVDLARHYGFDIIKGSARFVSSDSIDVDGRELRAGKFLIATGSASWAPPIEGLEGAGYLTSTTAMELKELPESMIVVGGNYIGLEMGQLFASLGTKVTIVEALERVAPLEEPEISEWMGRILVEQGIEVVVGARVLRAETGERKVVVAEIGEAERRFEAAELLVATGRRPVLEGLELNTAGIQTDARGSLVLDEELRTTNNAVFAAGDVTGAPQFVYVAAAQGTVAADNAIGDAGRKMDYTALPRVTFTTPNIAAVGLTDQQARSSSGSRSKTSPIPGRPTSRWPRASSSPPRPSRATSACCRVAPPDVPRQVSWRMAGRGNGGGSNRALLCLALDRGGGYRRGCCRSSVRADRAGGDGCGSVRSHVVEGSP
ncbi:MAG: FAD-dependent oxidoreductase, partial [Actinobacteria bacterium]|nr:FAD-dependent oxidoreductase [Actinomycetota bacterium]